MKTKPKPPKHKCPKSDRQTRSLGTASCASWFRRGWALAAASTYLGAKGMTYASFRAACYGGDARHPELAVMRPCDRNSAGCKASISPKGYSPRLQFLTAWDIFISWFEVDKAYQMFLYLPNGEKVLVGKDIAGGQFHRWENTNDLGLARAEPCLEQH